jgi:ABC-type antimicrobial peptide transport system permease subunit
LLLAGLGAAAGLLFAAGVARTMTSMLFGVTAGDLTSFVAATLTLLLVTVLASYLPARRAAAIDPAVTLRAE